jgi:hypothetical protein
LNKPGGLERDAGLSAATEPGPARRKAGHLAASSDEGCGVGIGWCAAALIDMDRQPEQPRPR